MRRPFSESACRRGGRRNNHSSRNWDRRCRERNPLGRSEKFRGDLVVTVVHYAPSEVEGVDCIDVV